VDADAEERAGVSTSASEEPGRTDPGGSNGRAPDEPGTSEERMANSRRMPGPRLPAGLPLTIVTIGSTVNNLNSETLQFCLDTPAGQEAP